MVRRIIAGVILIGLGLALFGSQVSTDPGRMPFGLVLLLLWGGTGLAILAGRSWGRPVGLALSAIGPSSRSGKLDKRTPARTVPGSLSTSPS